MAESAVAEMIAPGAAIAGRYRVEGALGVGGMGAVYRVHDPRRARTVALKQLRAPNGAHKELLTSQFEREYHTLSQLAHPSIIEVYEYGIDEAGNPFYTMELLDGEDLRERPRPTWRQACALLRDVASSLAIMHARRLLHRDISARNIRCTTDGRAKLIDFGAMAPMGVLKHIVGTPPFVPPEAVHLQPVDGAPICMRSVECFIGCSRGATRFLRARFRSFPTCGGRRSRHRASTTKTCRSRSIS